MYFCIVKIKHNSLTQIKMEAIGYFTSPKVAKVAYPATALDTAKKSADILLQAIDGNYYTLWLNKEVEIKGRGIKERTGKMVVVTENAYYRLKEKFNILTDF